MGVVQTEEVDIKIVLQRVVKTIVFLKKKWLIIAAYGIIGATIGFFYANSFKTTYPAIVNFIVEDENPSSAFGGSMGLASQFGFDFSGASRSLFTGANLVELMQSRFIIEKTLLDSVKHSRETVTFASLFLKLFNKKKTSTNKDGKKILFNLGASRSHFSIEQDSVLGVIYQIINAKHLNVKQKDKKINIISAEVSSENPLFSKFFVEALVNTVSEFYIETKTKKYFQSVRILERQIDSVKGALNAAISGVAIASDQVFNLNSALNINRIPTTRGQIDVQANTVILTELVKNLEVAKMALRRETPLIQVIDAPILPLDKKKSSRLKAIFFGGVVAIFFSIVGLLIFKWVKNNIL